MVAGGSGRRFGGRKQFLPLAGHPVASWSVRAANTVADGVVLVVPAAGDDATDSPPPAPGATGEDALGATRVVSGGATRADSVRAGLAAVPADAAVIVVHDAARPMATPGLFASVVDAVRSGDIDGAIPVVPVADTLKRVEGGRVVATVDRDGLVAVQTPQAFAAAALRAAHAGGGEATDDAGLLEAAGLTVAAVEGDPGNLKLTRPEDLALAEALVAGARS
ncbi:MAG TPA: 2-C-methyl-D-erythritol 4-phosphate cytidylyltransferase [Acidimicrobiales bacterium]